MESGLIFNQLICEFESRHPCQIIADCQLPIDDRIFPGPSLPNQSAIGNRQCFCGS